MPDGADRTIPRATDRLRDPERRLSSSDSEPRRPRALAALLEGRARFLRFLERRVGSREDAEEILQHAFAAAVAEPALDAKEDAVRWFYRVLRNALVDAYRRRDAAARAHDARVRATPEAIEPEDESAACACVTALLPSLKPEYADVLRRVDLDEAAADAVARELGVTVGAVRVRLHRAREALRRSVFDMCRACAKHGCLDCTCGSR